MIGKMGMMKCSVPPCYHASRDLATRGPYSMPMPSLSIYFYMVLVLAIWAKLKRLPAQIDCPYNSRYRLWHNLVPYNEYAENKLAFVSFADFFFESVFTSNRYRHGTALLLCMQLRCR